MNSRPSNFSVEDYNHMNIIDSMNSISPNDTIVSEELDFDTDSFADKILNFQRIESNTNNSVYNKQMCLEKSDEVFSNFSNQNDKHDCHNDDLNYDILDLDNLEYITYKSRKETTTNFKFDGRSDNVYFLYEHNYYMKMETAPYIEQTLDTSKLKDCYKTEEKSSIDIPYFNGVDVGDLNDSPQFCCTECNLQESVNFEIIPNSFSIDNISIYTISDDEQGKDDIEVPELEVISISSASAIEDRLGLIDECDCNSCGYHSSDFEFIEENEAKKDGLIINYNPQELKNGKVKTIEIAKEYNSQELILDYFHVPAVTNNIESKISQDTNYISMFDRNIPYPVHCMENKSIHTNNYSMNAEYQDLGFNMNLHGRERVDKHIQDEANESENKILFMYPSENSRMRQRRRI